jgi:phosphohistidine phosphatase
MDCILIRHGIAVEPEEWTGAEPLRPLTAKGKRRVRQVARGLAALGVVPTHLLTSPLTRARETAEIIHTVLCPAIGVELRKDLSVGSAPERIVAMLRTYPSDAIVLCVGHEPLLSHSAALLLCGQSGPGLAMKKSGAGCIHVPPDGMPGQAVLRWWLQPAHLRAIGKQGKD